MKRSSHVALLVMGVTGVGVGGYALSGPRDCSQQTTMAPGPGASGQTSCGSSSSSHGGSGGSGSRWSRSVGPGGSATTTPSGGSSIGSTIRAGFGSFGRALSGGG